MTLNSSAEEPAIIAQEIGGAECGASVPQAARARWAYGKGK